MIGESPAFLELLDLISRLAPIDRPILVLGERGTGKELVAERLHYLSGRWDGPLVRTNCAALAEGVLDSELFGHEAGAFTGAVRRHAGRFERAGGGTLFLDEIASASGPVQEKLLRAVEYGEIERIGGTTVIRVDVRVVAATNVDLRKEAQDGRFRADLLDRLAFDVVRVPPLRERKGDIGLLAEHFARAMAADLSWPGFPGFSDSCMAALVDHDWPGNIRELRNAVERSMVHAGDPRKPIPRAVLDPFSSRPTGKRTPPTATASPVDDTDDTKDMTAETDPTTMARLFALSRPSIHLHDVLSEVERELLDAFLIKGNHNLKNTANLMGLSYDQLRSILKKHGRRFRERRHKQ